MELNCVQFCVHKLLKSHTKASFLYFCTSRCHKMPSLIVLLSDFPAMDHEFESTYRNYYPMLYRIAAKMLQDPEGAKDVVQDVFTAYCFARKNEKAVRDTKNWLVRCVINKGIDYRKKNSRTVAMESLETETVTNPQGESPDIMGAMERLNDKERALVVLYSEGYSYKEIAAMTGRNVNSIGKTLSRIIEKIRRQLL